MTILKDQIVLELNKPDAYGNIWSTKAGLKAIKEYNKEFVKNDRAFGECRSSLDESNLIVNLHAANHRIIKLKIKDNFLVCDIEILDTISGKILSQSLETENTIQLIPRAIGHRKEDEDGNNLITEAEIICFDTCTKSNR